MASFTNITEKNSLQGVAWNYGHIKWSLYFFLSVQKGPQILNWILSEAESYKGPFFNPMDNEINSTYCTVSNTMRHTYYIQIYYKEGLVISIEMFQDRFPTCHSVLTECTCWTYINTFHEHSEFLKRQTASVSYLGYLPSDFPQLSKTFWLISAKKTRKKLYYLSICIYLFFWV